jgi:hypothetical protein
MRYLPIFLILFFILFYGNRVLAQCNGTLGDPIKNETFGSGTSTFGSPLPNGVTNYTYITGSPEDGQYTIAKTISGLNGVGFSRL